ncbi:MAG: hypothetical protein ABSG67_04735 [Thermoguttaceae bacterium]
MRNLVLLYYPRLAAGQHAPLNRGAGKTPAAAHEPPGGENPVQPEGKISAIKWPRRAING